MPSPRTYRHEDIVVMFGDRRITGYMRGDFISVDRDDGPCHGVDGWALERYDWEAGRGIFHYERVAQSGATERADVERAQPAGPQHAGWR
jgi:hypothetical protein